MARIRDRRQITLEFLNLSANGGGSQGKSVKNRWNLEENLLSATYFHKILYHQTTINSTRIKEVKTVPCTNWWDQLQVTQIYRKFLSLVLVMKFVWSHFQCKNIHSFRLPLHATYMQINLKYGFSVFFASLSVCITILYYALSS